MSIAPDSNITSASDEETVFISLGGVDLPFERNPDEAETSATIRGIAVAAYRVESRSGLMHSS